MSSKRTTPRPPVPLEAHRLRQPEHLSGQSGLNRSPDRDLLQIDAKNDIDALILWIDRYRDPTATNYRKEGERLLLWANEIHGKALSDLNADDMLAYGEFLMHPPASWIGPPKPRHHKDWKPFSKPLIQESIEQAMTVLNSLFTFLVQAGYLLRNPLMLGHRGKRRTRDETAIERYLERDALALVFLYIEDFMPKETVREQAHQRRARWIFMLLYYSGIRRAESAHLKMNDFRFIEGEWWLRVHGKGNKIAEVPVNDELLGALCAYRRSINLPELPSPREHEPAIRALNGRTGVGDKAVYLVVKDIFARAAHHFKKSDPEWAHTISNATTHWLRHTSATHQLQAGIDIRKVMLNLRHSKLDTTLIYTHEDRHDRHREMARLQHKKANNGIIPET